jgi:hypothetical protein
LEQKPPPVFKNNFSFVHISIFNLVTKNCRSVATIQQKRSAISKGCLEAFPEDFWDEIGMVGNMEMSTTQ